MLKQSLPYSPDVRPYFQAIRDLPWACWLDSGVAHGDRDRFDVLAADPFHTLTFQNGKCRIEERDGSSQQSGDSPLAVVRGLLGKPADAQGDLPFTGGAIGYFSYDYAVRLELQQSVGDSDFPGIALGIYDWAVVVDHYKKSAWLVGQGRDPATEKMWEKLVGQIELSVDTPLPVAEVQFNAQPEANMTREEYGAAYKRIQQYLRDGDCYQVNFAQAFRIPFTGDPWSLYQSMRKQNPAPYGAYLQFPFGQVLSSSPEQFLGLWGRQAVTRPIKGTRPRSSDKEADQRLMRELRSSAKEQAENLMIVDLLRNDLGRVCKPGTIQVPELFAVESYPTVHHLVSTVTGELDDGEDAISLLQACFPGGSITGAPKHRAMEIIQELEPEPRKVYCGSIGWIGFDGNMGTNIAIRTSLLQDNLVTYWAGGGIVADSEEESEYQESLHKAAAFFGLVGGDQ